MNDSQIEIGEPAAGDERNFRGWITVAVIVVLLALLSLVNYFSSPRAAEVAKSHAEAELKSAVELQSGLSTGQLSPIDQRLQDAAAEMRPFLKKDPNAALLYAVIETELKKPLNPNDLEALKTGKTSLFQAAYQIYSHSQLSPQLAHALSGEFQGTRLLFRLVQVQAEEKAGLKGARANLVSKSKQPLVLGLGALLLAAFGLGALLLFAYVVARTSGLLKPLGLRLAGLRPADADRVMIRCGQIFALFVGIQLFGGLLLGGMLDKDFVDVPFYLAIIFGILWLSRQPVEGKQLSLASLGLNRENFGRNVLWGVAGAVANVPVLALLTYVSSSLMRQLPAPEHPVTIELQHADSFLVVLKLVLTASVAAPFIEEIMFRGTLYPALASVLRSPLWGAVISSAAFAMIHPTGIPAWPALAAIGGMSCLLSYQTKSLVPSMVMHGVHNLATLIAALVFLR